MESCMWMCRGRSLYASTLRGDRQRDLELQVPSTSQPLLFLTFSTRRMADIRIEPSAAHSNFEAYDFDGARKLPSDPPDIRFASPELMKLYLRSILQFLLPDTETATRG